MPKIEFFSTLFARIRSWFEPAPPPPPPEAPPESDGRPTIGVAWMEKDRTIYVRIRLEDPDGRIGDVNLRYPKRHPRYRDIVAYLGLAPGQAKTIAEFDVRPR